MRVEIDKNSGFCFGVVNAIRKAEEELERNHSLYCIGDIVHNDMEVERLKRVGLKTISHEEFVDMRDCRVMFRAHGEPPSSYEIAQRHQIEIIDASCPVVLDLQKKIRKAYKESKIKGGTIIIYGKPGHAEVLGLLGQTDGEALVVESESDLERVKLNPPIILFSQTTRSLDGFNKIAERVKKLTAGEVYVNDTICRKVANRIPQLKKFSSEHDVILFVSGEKSSNGKQLYAVCREINPKTYFIEGVADLREEMVAGAESVGISGATSTPHWVMEKVMERVKSYRKQ